MPRASAVASPTPPTPKSMLRIAANCQATIVVALSLDRTHDRLLAARHACHQERPAAGWSHGAWPRVGWPAGRTWQCGQGTAGTRAHWWRRGHGPQADRADVTS